MDRLPRRPEHMIQRGGPAKTDIETSLAPGHAPAPGLSRRRMREVCGWLLLGALGVFALACSDPAYPDGMRCSEAQTCPPHQMCDLDGTCRDSSSPAPGADASPSPVEDASPSPPVEDASPSPSVDARPSPIPDAGPDAGERCQEIDIDCGGPQCGRCDDDEPCAQASDCAAGACVDGLCASQASCDVLRQVSPDVPSGTYTIEPEGIEQPFPVYCEMAGDAGWTLVLKIDGEKNTFLYNSAHWTNESDFGSNTDLSLTEAKSPAFRTVLMTQVRVVMRDGGTDRDLAVSFEQPLSTLSTLHALFTGPFRGTNNSRDEWLGLVASGSLQTRCQRQGLNNGATGQALRIGIFGNEQNHCLSCDSFVGIGHSSIASGNVARSDDSGAGGRDTRTFSFVYVR